MKPRIGLMTVSLPPELSTVPPEAVQAADDLGVRAEKAFRGLGMDVVRIAKQCQSVEASTAAAKELMAADVDCVIFMVGSWIYVPIVCTPAQMLTVPFILWGVPEYITGALVPACITHGSLDELGIKHKFVKGFPEDDALLKDVGCFARSAMVVNRMKGMRYGLFGGRCMYMYTAAPDPIQVQKLFGVETVHVDEFMLVFKAKEFPDDKIQAFYRDLKKEYGRIEPPDEVMNRSIRMYFALKELVKEYDLDFVGLKCMPEVQGNYVSHCLSVALNINEGLICGCEADTNGALSMEILHLLSGGPAGFGDVFDVRNSDKSVRIVNCGSNATDFAVNHKDVDWGYQYDFIAAGPGRGATTVFVNKPGRVTTARLARISGDYVMHIASGEAYTEPKSKMKEARDRWPHLFLRLDGDPDAFYQNCRSNHQHWTYGNYVDELVSVCDLLGIRPIVT